MGFFTLPNEEKHIDYSIKIARFKLKLRTMRNFKKLEIWKKGFQIAVNGFKITKNYPTDQRFGLCSQITRAGVSIPSNIAEGSSRKSDKDYNRFIEHSLGSSFEMETQLLIGKELGFGDLQLTEITLELLSEEEKMLYSFMTALKT